MTTWGREYHPKPKAVVLARQADAKRRRKFPYYKTRKRMVGWRGSYPGRFGSTFASMEDINTGRWMYPWLWGYEHSHRQPKVRRRRRV